MRIRVRHLATAAALLAMPALAGAQATAQGGEANPDADEEEIVVTAQKIEQTVADVPLTISAVTGRTLADIGVSDLDEVANYIPGLTIQEQSANNPGIVIRGITSDNGSAQQGARVTLYYNGVDISRSRGAYQDLYDLDRIEVVKGPQATLFGTAAAVGAIGLVSARPRPGFSGGFSANYGNFDRYQASGYVNAGSDTLAGRIAFAYKKRDGYVRNIAGDPDVPNQNGGRVNQDDLNGQDQRGVRGSLRWRPTDAVTADLVLTYDGQRNPGTAFKSRALAPTGGFRDGRAFDDYGVAELSGSPFSREVLGARKLGLKRDVYDANLTLAWELNDALTLTTVNGYREFDANEVFDADGSGAFYLEFAEDAQGRQFSHETRFSFDTEQFRGFFGFNAFFEKGFQRVPFSTEEGTYLACSVAGALAPVRAALARAGVVGCVAPDGTVTAARATAVLTGGAATVLPYSSVFQNNGENNSYSLFADVTYIPFPQLELTAGVRLLTEDRKSGYRSTQPNSVILRTSGLLPTANTNDRLFEAERSFNAVLPRFNALFRLSEDVNVYATYSEGRRSPVVQLAAANVRGTVVPNLQIIPEERVKNYEAGVKGGFGGINAQAAVYYQQYDDFQVSVVENAMMVTRSAGSAGNFGAEAEVNARLSPFLTAFASIGYIDGGIEDEPTNGVFAGDRFRLQPEIEAAGGVFLRVPVGDFTLYASPSVTYQSRVFFELPNRPEISTPGYTLVNARAGIEGPDRRWSVGGFVRNAFDEEYLIDAGNTGGGFGIPTYIAGEPRFYGIEASVRFGEGR
ncbi:MAG: TonB-dependent receptor [uncultured Sphingomonadaceae bacterium]|uniref:TonB-dependent receptor n=1 Tax=uncultured Sphingomonadaceae bacterium TaxID=169976 RepID=A0A6J4T0B1_9SPHN|nr:MAG: TonB-dependent receptor [uncultured Sphingomonadaceae bacterium]